MHKRTYLLYLATLKLLLNDKRYFMLDHLHERQRPSSEAADRRAIVVLSQLEFVEYYALSFPPSGDYALPAWLGRRYSAIMAVIDACISQSNLEWMLEFQFLRRVRVTAAEARSADSCSICLETFREGSVTAIPQCGHRFHWDCIARWYDTAYTCPICRRYVLENVDVDESDSDDQNDEHPEGG